MITRLETAEKTYQRTLNKIECGTTQELLEINKRIEEAVSKGCFSFSEAGVLSNVTEERLIELGYKVKTGSQYNKYYYTISWNMTE